MNANPFDVVHASRRVINLNEYIKREIPKTDDARLILTQHTQYTQKPPTHSPKVNVSTHKHTLSQLLSAVIIYPLLISSPPPSPSEYCVHFESIEICDVYYTCHTHTHYTNLEHCLWAALGLSENQKPTCGWGGV